MPARANVGGEATGPLALISELSGQGNSRARREAAIKLLRSDSAEVAQTLLVLLNDKNNESVKAILCEAMAEIKCQEPVYTPALFALVQSRESTMAIRQAAAAALIVYRDLPPEGLEKLKAFRQERDAILLAESHAALMKALYDCTAEADRPALMQAWLQQPLALERFTALELVQQNLRKGVPSDAVLAGIRALLADPDEPVRQKAVLVLRTLGQHEDAPRLRAMLQQRQPPAVREAIYAALGALGDADSLSVVMCGLDDDAPGVVAEVATALARLIQQQPPPASDVINAALDGLLHRAAGDLHDSTLRERIIDAMATLAEPRFGSVLLEHAGGAEPNPAVRQSALRGLGKIGDKSALLILIQQLAHDSDAGVREAAAEAIGRIAVDRESLFALSARLDTQIEPSASVQTKVWDAFLQVYARLPGTQQREVLDNLIHSGFAGPSRCVDLLTIMESLARESHASAELRASLAQQLADALIAANREADAASILAYELDALTGSASVEQVRVAERMIELYLKSAPEKAIAAAAAIRNSAAREAAAQRLVTYVQSLSKKNQQEAAQWLDRLRQGVPDEFGPRFAIQFDRARQSILPASRSATTPAQG